MKGPDIYRAILLAIQAGDYQPGEPLREEEVAARFGVSRTPIREALGRLRERGLLQAGPGRSVVVAILTISQIIELYTMRQELEGIVARLAAHHATAAEVSNLERLNKLIEKTTDPKEAAGLNRQFHARLYDAARNRYLQQAMELLQETIALLPETNFIMPGRNLTAFREHADIIEAVRDRDAERAKALAVDHIRASLEVRLAITPKFGG